MQQAPNRAGTAATEETATFTVEQIHRAVDMLRRQDPRPEIRELQLYYERARELGAPPEVLHSCRRELERRLRELELRQLREMHMTMTPYAAWHGGLAPPDRQRQAAIARGEKLLREWLSPAQLADYDKRGSFEVIGGVTGRRYRIERPASYNVHALTRAGSLDHRICFAPVGELVNGDIMLAQKLALETNEAAALGVANVEAGPHWRYAGLRSLLPEFT